MHSKRLLQRVKFNNSASLAFCNNRGGHASTFAAQQQPYFNQQVRLFNVASHQFSSFFNNNNNAITLSQANMRMSYSQQQQQQGGFDRGSVIGALVGPGSISIEEEAGIMERVSILKDHLEQEDISAQERLEANEELFDLYNKLCQTSKATVHLQDALELKKEIYGPVSENVLQTLRRLRDVLNLQRRHQEAITVQFQVISLMAKLVNFRTDANSLVDEEQVKSSQKFAPEWFIVGDLYFKLSQYTHARDAFKRCTTILSKFFTRHDLMTRCNVRLGFVHYKLNQFKEAVEVLEKEVNKPGEMEKVFSDVLELSDMYLNLGNACMYLKNPQKSEIYYKKAIDTIKGAWQANKDNSAATSTSTIPNNTKLGELLYSLAVVYTSQKEQHKLAESIIEDAMQIFNYELTNKKPSSQEQEDSLRQHICECLMMRGMLHHAANRMNEAKDFFKRALVIVEPLSERFRKTDASDLPVSYCRDVGFVHIRLGEILSESNSDEAIHLYREAIDIMTRCVDMKQVRHLLAECYKEYGTYLFKQQDFKKAKENLSKSYNLYSEMAVLDFDPDLGHVSRMLGDMLVPKNDYKQALSFYDEAAGLMMLQGVADDNVKECLELMRRTGESMQKHIEDKQKKLEALEVGKINTKEGADGSRVVVRKDKLSGMKMSLDSERRFLAGMQQDATAKQKILEFKKQQQQPTKQ